MKLPVIAALAAVLALSACSDADWSHGMSFIGLDDSGQAASEQAAQPAQPAPTPVKAVQTPVAQAGQPNAFCENVAKQDSEGNGFDPATQQGVFARSYRECVGIFGNAVPRE